MNSRPKITANMVTMARIVLLPVPCAFLIYGGTFGTWMAFILYTLLGATDFVDGAMARREGPTKLGGLIDPVADKIFVASICLGLVAINLMPVWALVAILLREFFITALRTSVSLRNEAFRTSTLAKIKTFVQMGGFGTVFLTIALTPPHALIVAIILFVGVFGFYLIYWIQKKRTPPYWALPTALSFLYWAFLAQFFSPADSIFWQYVVIVSLTWVSCFDYILSSYKMFMRTGIMAIDCIRIAWAVVHTALAAPLVALYPELVLPLLVSISFELALGGVDMLVASDQKYAGILPFLATSITATVIWFAVFANYMQWVSIPIFWSTAVLAAISIAAFAFTFLKWQFLFRRAFTA